MSTMEAKAALHIRATSLTAIQEKVQSPFCQLTSSCSMKDS